jgi:diadenosine tetraphosphate (Ap4A) HIT family hydrolase
VIDGTKPHEHQHIHRDDTAAIAFLSRFQTLLGHVLVAPIEHRENVVTDVTMKEYVRLQDRRPPDRPGHLGGAAHRAAPQSG